MRSECRHRLAFFKFINRRADKIRGATTRFSARKGRREGGTAPRRDAPVAFHFVLMIIVFRLLAAFIYAVNLKHGTAWLIR